jgi:hypothetical protein
MKKLPFLPALVIDLAKVAFPSHEHCFEVSEMLKYVTSLPDASVGGVLSLFTIFHLERTKHVRVASTFISLL